MEHFTPISATLGGLLIGLAAAGLLLFNGRIAGISGILGGLLDLPRGDVSWRGAFIAGLIAGGLLLLWFYPQALALPPDYSFATYAIAGLLVGYGTRLGSGCTSGHGVCGIARLSPRSLAAVATFMVSALVTVFVVRHVL
ncbi:MAG: YeeE/YedE family protein [Gammaproteobacteria bacterium]|nr:MAG: YeeE/YedE family protein [Gammaproteobacteria bacterium]